MPTSPRKIETPTGPKIGNLFRKLEILGVSSFLTQTGNQGNEQRQWEEFSDIPVPPGTVAIIPSQDYWLLAHGSITELLDPLDENVEPEWNSSDRPWGLGRASIAVTDLNAVDTSQNPATQTAQILVRMNLIDYNADDSWFGILGFTLTFLGNTASTSTITAAGFERNRKIMWNGGRKRMQ